MSNDRLIGRKGRDLVSIPIPQIDIPHFRFGGPGSGVGQGRGEPGDQVAPGEPDGGNGGRKAGDQPGQHILEVEMTLDELADILGEELELPRIRPKQRNNVLGEVYRYTSARRVGPESLRLFRATYTTALKRMIAAGIYDPLDPVVLPVKEDKRYRSRKCYPRPESNAVVFYMMDVSGSMSDERKRLVRLTAFWIDTWLQRHYQNVINRYIVHDAAAKEVNADVFYTIRESGGTKISSAIQLCSALIERDYCPEDWNLYGFHFSDGENWGDDDDVCRKILVDGLLPTLNMFCYGQVKGWDYAQKFMSVINEIETDNILTASIEKDDDIYTAIKIFLGKGL